MAPDVSLVIPYDSGVSRKKSSLSSDVQQLVRQKGQFRNVTERSLSADIAITAQDDLGNGDNDDEASGDEDGTITESIQETRDKLFQKQAEWHQMCLSMQQQIGAVIDVFTATLAEHSKVAEAGMSAQLKQVVPVRSMESREVEAKPTGKKRIRELKDISTIIRTKALSSASAKLSAASVRLDAEAQKQAKYWEQLAGLRSAAWPISRLPNDGRAIVVHFGSAESAPQYRNKGVALLRQDDNGDLVFPGQSDLHKRKRLSVAVYRSGKLTGQAQSRRSSATSQNRLSQDLRDAREGLFEEELFNEAIKEARSMANMGVKTRSSSVEVAISDSCSIVVSYNEQSDTQGATHTDDELAQFVVTGLRSMLVAEHQQKYLQRSEHKLPPMSHVLRTAPEYALLRPVVAQLRHNCEIAPLFEVLDLYTKSFVRAGLALTVDQVLLDESKFDFATLQNLRQVVVSDVRVELPTAESLTMRVETYLAAPRFGTRFSSEQYRSECGSSMLPSTASYEDVSLFLGDVLAREICAAVIRSEEGEITWQLGEKYPAQLLLARGDEEPLATLAFTCADGKIAACCMDADRRMKRQAEWHGEGLTVLLGEEQPNEPKKDIVALVVSWKEDFTSKITRDA